MTDEHRMGAVVWLIMTAMMMGEDVLVHCRQGKHRSSVVCLLIMMIICDGGRPKSWCRSEGLDVLEPDLILDPPGASRKEVFGKTNFSLERGGIAPSMAQLLFQTSSFQLPIWFPASAS